MKTVIIMLIFIISLSVLVTGCIESEPKTSDNGTNAQSDKQTLDAAMIFGPSESLDPAYKWVGWYTRKAGIYETLFSYDENMNLQPELAKSYEQVNNTTWKINLEENIEFHDGSQLNADAVIYSLERVIDPSNNRSSQYDFIKSVSKIDDYTVKIETKKPYAPTIASLTDPVVSIVSPNASDIDNNPVGTGPFKFDSFDKGIKLSVVNNKNYWNGDVELDEVNLYYVSDPVTRSMQLQGKDVDIARGIPPEEEGVIRNKSDFEIKSREALRTAFMYVNTKKPPLDDVNVRRALNYAIDREQAVNTALEGVGGTPAKSLYPSVLQWSVNDEIDGYNHNPEKAKQLLSDAGISDTDGDGWLDYQGETLELTIKTYQSRPELKPTTEVIATQFKDIGIKTNVRVLESGALSSDMNNGNYDLALYAWGVAPTGDPDYFLSKHFESTGTNAEWTGYNNSDVDRWIELGRETMNNTKRKHYYDEVQKQVIKDSPEIFVFNYKEIVGERKNVEGYRIYPNEITFLTENVRINGE
ncbi:MAG: ABC transporter substrate-binding protein [Methanohalobium sp.]|uniref:ABC transporter substrate-binding protein n=1 Tax=Methanohalobium sp. TaxID=2837493 RepID=UPI003979DF53